MKEKSLEVITGYYSMRHIDEELNTHHNFNWCGYLRQPIRWEKGKKNTYRISGMCALDKQECNYSAPQKTYVCDLCQKYKERVKR